jgi:hypothetical protein
MLDQGPAHARDDEEKFFREKKTFGEIVERLIASQFADGK